MEEMNARLVAHIRALQSELRKYMDFDKVRPFFCDPLTLRYSRAVVSN